MVQTTNPCYSCSAQECFGCANAQHLLDLAECQGCMAVECFCCEIFYNYLKEQELKEQEQQGD